MRNLPLSLVADAGACSPPGTFCWQNARLLLVEGVFVQTSRLSFCKTLARHFDYSTLFSSFFLPPSPLFNKSATKKKKKDWCDRSHILITLLFHPFVCFFLVDLFIGPFYFSKEEGKKKREYMYFVYIYREMVDWMATHPWRGVSKTYPWRMISTTATASWPKQTRQTDIYIYIHIYIYIWDRLDTLPAFLPECWWHYRPQRWQQALAGRWAEWCSGWSWQSKWRPQPEWSAREQQE